ncbi:hypothetical protein [Enterococcus faecalis]|uniref:hypothetical protein n=1 Tax=Enterococcus faecalis TaxID=1351 RepID=UPI001E36D23D|nr:hypothetical protein [Enterococcus faecalis]
MGVVYAIIIIVPSIFFTWLFILHNRLNHIECKMSNLSERQIRIMRCIQPTPDGWKVTGKMKGEKSTYQDSRTGAILPTREHKRPPQLKGEKPMLTANEAFLVREAVREKIETLRDAVRHESAKHPIQQDIHTLKHFQTELARYEITYQKMLNEVGC